MPKITFPFASSAVSSEFGWRVLGGRRNHHNGIDFAVAGGTPIKSMAVEGLVVEEGWNAELGWFVRIRLRDAAPRLSTGYAHMARRSHLRVGQRVVAHDDIGPVGTTGLSTGNHLHLETWKDGSRINPRDWLVIANGIWDQPTPAPQPAGGGGSHPGAEWIDLTGWYWYTSPDQAQALRNPRKPFLDGKYPIIGRAPNGAVQVLSNSRGRIWVHSSANGAAPAPAPAPSSLVGRELDLTPPWYWYKNPDDARRMLNVHGKRRGEIMLSGRGYKVLAEDGGALQVHSRSMGTVWLHPDARHRVI